MRSLTQKRGLIAAMAVAAGMLLSSGAASAAGLINGDFEDGPPSIGTGGNDYYRGIPNGWTQMAGQDVVDIIANGYTQQPGVILSAQSGTHFIDGNGLGASGGFYQDVSGLTV